MILSKSTHRWKANIVRDQLAGMVAYEIVPTIDGVDQEGLAVPFDPRVEYREGLEPFPWVVV